MSVIDRDEDSARIAAKCPHCGTAFAENANFCSACGLQRANLSMARVGEAGASLYSTSDGSRKQITVLFADLVGSLQLIQRVDPEEAQALIDAVLRVMIQAVHHYEGTITQTLGDGILALFGAPTAYEDHAVRAATAALAMQKAVRSFDDAGWRARGMQPQIRVGLHSGDVAVSSIRSDLSVEYRAVGITTHLAARMEGLAAPGAVLLTPETMHLGRGALRARSLGPTTIKGVDKPIEVFELTGIVRTRFHASALRALSPLVNRQDTLRMLQAVLEDVRAGSARVVAMSGDPGIGKSRLCHEVLRQAAEHFQVLEVSAPSHSRAVPQGFLAEVARAVFVIDDEDDVERLRLKVRDGLERLGHDLGAHLNVALELLDIPSRDPEWEKLDPVQKRRRIEATLVALIEAWCARGPSILLFEDLHWCDEASLRLIARLVEAPPATQALLLFTHRPEFVAPWSAAPHLTCCSIGRLNAEQSEQLLEHLISARAGFALLRERLAKRTDGNPFFIEESVRALVETGALGTYPNASRAPGQLPPDAQLELLNVPATIEALLGARIDRLPKGDLELLQAAAVIGDDSPLEVLRLLAHLSPAEFAQRLDVLARAELLYETATLTSDAADTSAPMPSASTFRFQHALIEDVVYKRIVRARRRYLHRRFVAIMEEHHKSRLTEHLERMAEHTRRAELWDKCAEYHRRACVRAASRSANAHAIAHLERGLEAQARVAPGAERDRAAIDLRLTALAPLLPTGAHERLITLLREAEHYAETLGDQGRLAKISSQLSTELWLTGQYDLGRQAAERARGLLAALGGDQFALASACRYNLAMIHHARGEFEPALAILRELAQQFVGPAALRRLGWAGYPSVLTQTFIISVNAMTGGFAEAEAAFRQGSALAVQLDHPFSRTMILEQHGMCLLVQGEWERAATVLGEALAICLKDEVETMYLPIASHLGIAMLETGNVSGALELLQSASAKESAAAGHYALDYLYIALAETQLRTGDPLRALATAERAMQETRACGEAGFHVRALLQRAAALSTLAGREAEAELAYSQAHEAAQLLGMRPWQALAREGQARLFAARSKREAAIEALAAARQIWLSLGARARVARIDAWSWRDSGSAASQRG